MSSFQGRENAFQARTGPKACQSFRVGNMRVANPAAVVPKTVLRPNAGIIQSRGDGMNGSGLAVAVLKHITVAAVQDAGLAEAQRGGMLTGLIAPAARLDAHQLHVLVIDKRVEDTCR